jgi:hypothetical protein
MQRRVLRDLAVVGMLLGSAAAGAAAPLPKVSFVHSGLIERYCSTVSPVKPDPAVLAELDARMGEFEAAWAQGGPALMAETVRLTGQPYRYAETLATLHACADMPSYSSPLLISAARYTRAWAASPEPREGVAGLEPGKVLQGPPKPRTLSPLSSFVYTVWHESGHRYVDDVLSRLPGGTTPLLQKYASEHPVTLSHLHLLALDKLIYARLGRSAEFEARHTFARETNAKPMLRVYEILDAEGAERFVAELRGPKRAPRG